MDRYLSYYYDTEIHSTSLYRQWFKSPRQMIEESERLKTAPGVLLATVNAQIVCSHQRQEVQAAA